MEPHSVNPFIHRIHLSKLDKVKIGIGTFTLLPIRVVLCLLILLIACIVSQLSMSIARLSNGGAQHISSWYKWPTLKLLRFMFFVGGFYWINVIDKSGQDQDEKNRKAPIIVAAPHSAMTDILPYILFDAPSVVAKKQALDFPLFGSFLKLTDPILVERESEVSRQRTIEEIKCKAQKSEVFIFPEGTCTNRRSIIQFKLGAFLPGLPVQPIALRYNTHKGMDPITWTWDGPNGFYLIYLLLCKWKHSLDIVKLPVYCPTKDEVSNAKLFADNVRHVISKELDVPLSFYSYDDVMLMDYCKQHSIPRSPACIKLIKVVHKITLQRNDAIDEHFRLQSNMSDVHSELVSSRILSLKSQADTQITDRASLLTLLEQFENSYVGQSTSVDELLEVLHHTSKGPIYANNLLSLLQLCNIATVTMKKRMKQGMKSLKRNGNSPYLSDDQFKLFLWYMIGTDCPVDQIPVNTSNEESLYTYITTMYKKQFEDIWSQLVDTKDDVSVDIDTEQS